MVVFVGRMSRGVGETRLAGFWAGVGVSKGVAVGGSHAREVGKGATGASKPGCEP